MTTIAYKDGVIAYDSQITTGNTITYDDYEKLKVVKGVKFVLCGATSDIEAFIDAYFGAPAAAKLDASALIVEGDRIWCAGHNKDEGLWKSPVELDRPYAIGSGSDHALTAMDMGATAYQAVEKAAKRDVSTGGMIRTLRVSGQEG